MKIKAGHRYVRRDGIVTGPLVRTLFSYWKFRDPGSTLLYNEHGHISERYEYPQDLIKEYKS